MFDPDKVGSIVWNNNHNDTWSTYDLFPENPKSIETVHVADFEKLAEEFLKMRKLFIEVYEQRKECDYHDELQYEIREFLFGDSE